METDYKMMAAEVVSLSEADKGWLPIMANVSAMIFEEMEGINWAGFYVMDKGSLLLGPFAGKVACIRIKVGKGVCGTAVERDETLVVPDVHAFAGHIACDSASRSEIVIPIHAGGRVVGVLDIDSPSEGRFSEEDRRGLEGIVRALEENIEWRSPDFA